MSSATHSQDEINNGLRAVLGHPVIYNFFGRIAGMPGKYRMYIGKFMKPVDNMRILDIGCGTSTILDYLPSSVFYEGYDINPAYINFAEKKYGHRAVFHNKRVNQMTLLKSEPYDVILADGLVHHLNDSEAKKLFQIGYKSLKKNGFMLTSDPAFIENQNRIAKFISSIDRGRHVRFPKDYSKIAESSFANIETHIIHDIGTVPMTACILKCWKD
ncbi:MAG: methyltransferase domain-containing protein [Desulfobacteraceae bacterium]|nr:class I SAM-dependent methyltransferase [Desulfobacteraceae bacterium]MBC2756736.1 methyltransferase domain-containing protein [Desulfobacteraceae bacterium]